MTDWKKSSHSGYNGECVEVAQEPQEVRVRDSKNPDGPVLVLTRAEWKRFLAVSKVPDRSAVPLSQLGQPVPPSDFQSSI